MRWLKDLLDWIGRWQVVQSVIAFIKPFVWPWIFAVLTAGAGYIGDQPAMWIVMASSLAFMGVGVGVFFSSTYRDRNSPLNKLLYAGTAFNYDLKPMERRARRAAATGAVQARLLEKTQIGVFIHNAAPFPISAMLESAGTEVEGLTPPRSLFPRKPVIITPGNTVIMSDDPISMDGHVCEKLEGKMDIRIRYGFPGNEKYSLQFKGRVEALMVPEGFLQGTYTHWDSDQSLPTK
jgi:hypothetical protein